jgi:uncharacterized membrane protein
MLYAWPRLLISTVVGVLAGFLLPADWRVTTKMLAGWDVGVGLFLVLVYQVISSADVARIRHRAALQDQGSFVILVLTAGSALASLGAIVAQLGAGSGGHAPNHLALAVLTILLSWFFTHTIFALHYAHYYYGETRGKGGGLTFPGDQQADYWDFVYFSFVIGMTAQVSDVAITSRTIRRTALAHGVVSFLFNTALLALGVNIAASAI